MSSIKAVAIGVISVVKIAPEVYEMVADYMDEMQAIKQSGTDRKTRVMAYARSLILKLGKDWDSWVKYISEFIDVAKSLYNLFKLAV